MKKYRILYRMTEQPELAGSKKRGVRGGHLARRLRPRLPLPQRTRRPRRARLRDPEEPHHARLRSRLTPEHKPHAPHRETAHRTTSSTGGKEPALTLAPEVRSQNEVRTKTNRLPVQRHFTREGVHPYDELDWELRSAVIEGADGKPVFEQHDIEFPATWSQNATNVVASKYFRGPLEPTRTGMVRERSVRAADRPRVNDDHRAGAGRTATSQTRTSATPSAPS